MATHKPSDNCNPSEAKQKQPLHHELQQVDTKDFDDYVAHFDDFAMGYASYYNGISLTKAKELNLIPFTEIEGFSETKEYISHFKDPLKGVAAREAGITLQEAKSLTWLKE